MTTMKQKAVVTIIFVVIFLFATMVFHVYRYVNKPESIETSKRDAKQKYHKYRTPLHRGRFVR